MEKIPRIPRSVIANAIDSYRTATGTRPDLWVVQHNDKKLIIKDFKRSDFLFRVIVGPILIRREFGAMRNLMSVKGIPQLAGKLDRYALAMEHIPGMSLDKIKPGILTSEFYTSLRDILDNMHARGVAHCDLRSRGNVMLGNDSMPYVVDFAACVYRGRGINPFIIWLFNQFVLADNNAILRIKQRLSPELITEEDKKELNTPLPFETSAKTFGETVRKITRKLLTKKV